MANKKTHTVRGTVHWAKVLGDPVANYSGDGREWTLDFTPNDKALEVIKELGLDDRMKNKNDERGDFMAFRQREKRKDGSFNRRISVTDGAGNPWPQDKLIGNGSVVDLKFEYKDYGKGKYAGVYPQSIRILDLKEFVPQHFAPLAEDDEFAGKAYVLEGDEGKLPEGMEPEPLDDDLEDDFPE